MTLKETFHRVTVKDILSYGRKDGAVARALVFHQCGPGSISRLGVICGFSLLLVSRPCPEGFLGYYDFPPSTKTNVSGKFQFDLEHTTPLNMFQEIYLVNKLQKLMHYTLAYRLRSLILSSSTVSCIFLHYSR